MSDDINKVVPSGSETDSTSTVTTVSNTDRIPRPASHKIAVGSIAGAFTIIVVWCLNKFTGIEIPAEVAQAFTMLGATLLSFLVPDDMEAP